ncbi:M16 family metallopeptidase [Naasia aerilata]|uniref:Peptidase M16 n=1 Tax=Naasia aerilata TaxID=1162966 RepID=A0ABM8GGZ2_9MICO|nr:pitrilysin family protein [Naasia aerilata]BDZ47611.1 peptidase M16 [Naasia aerilata]
MSGPVALLLDEPELTLPQPASTIRRSILPSGVRVLTEQVAGAQSATVGFWIPSGSRDETVGSLGSTHFLEHLLFKGTARRTALDIAIAFDAVGGEHNAATAKEYTCYYAKVRDRDLAMAVDVLADMVAASVLDPEEFELERGVILEELAMAEDDPADVANERLFEAVLGDHPLGRPIGGNPSTIESATRDGVAEHYRRSYRPSRLVVTAAGGVDHDQLVRWVEDGLSGAGWSLDLPAAPQARRPAVPAVLSQGAACTVIERPLEQTHLLLGVPGLLADDDRRATLAVLNAVLGGGMSSRLFQEVREKRGLAYSVYSFATSFSDAGLMGLYAATAPQNAVTVAELMLREFTELAERGVTADELRRSVGQLSGSSALALEDSDVRMSRLGRAEIGTGEFLDLDEQIRRFEAVTAPQVQELAGELLSRPLSLAAVGSADAAQLEGLLGSRTASVPA